MTNYQAIATVTATISNILADVSRDVLGTVVTTRPLDVIEGEPAGDRLNLFLYQVMPNNGYGNSDLPTRNKDGELIQRPQLGLDLYYLLTAYATDNDDLQAQRILTSAMRILHENPVLTREMIRNTIQVPAYNIANSDLADQVELVKISPQPLSLEEITKLWSSFFQTHYRISAAYQATVVLLESKQEPKPTLPVRERLLYVLPFRQPVIDKVEPQIVERTSDAKLTIIGRNLTAERVAVQFGGLEPTIPQSEDVTDNQITIAVPEELTAGIKPVRVIHPLMLGTPEVEHKGYESNVVAFVLAPRVTKIAGVNIPSATPVSVTSNTDLQIEFEPAVTPAQKAAILIGDYTVSVPARDPTSAPLKKLSIKIPANFTTGTYLIRLRVEGAESFLKFANNEFAGPKIEVT